MVVAALRGQMEQVGSVIQAAYMGTVAVTVTQGMAALGARAWCLVILAQNGMRPMALAAVAVPLLLMGVVAVVFTVVVQRQIMGIILEMA